MKWSPKRKREVVCPTWHQALCIWSTRTRARIYNDFFDIGKIDDEWEYILTWPEVQEV